MTGQRLTPETYAEVRHRWATRPDGYRQRDLANEFGIAQSHVSRIVNEFLVTEKEIVPPEPEEAGWWARGACVGEDTDLFFSYGEVHTLIAKEICNACPVREECLDYALTTRQNHGVWGGADEKERRKMRRRSKRKAPSNRTHLDAEQVRSLRQRGLTDTEIAGLFGTYREAVLRAAGPRSA